MQICTATDLCCEENRDKPSQQHVPGLDLAGKCARSSLVHSEVAFGGAGGKRHHRTPAGQ
eukprot:7361100-Prymnesium_polylepis.1